MNNILKILVAYHTDCNYLKQYDKEIYINILCGKKLYTGNNDFLLNKCLGDDTGENLSIFNKELNEMTALYWAYKNYEKIGCPQLIGLNHYNRCFTNDDIIKSLNYDIAVYENILPIINSKTLKSQFIRCHTEQPLKMLVDYLKHHNGDIDNINNKFNSTVFYPKNMFIMKRNLFFQYMEFMEKYILICKEFFKDNTLKIESNIRIGGFLLERISSIWFEDALKNNNGITLTIPRNYI